MKRQEVGSVAAASRVKTLEIASADNSQLIDDLVLFQFKVGGVISSLSVRSRRRYSSFEILDITLADNPQLNEVVLY